MKILGIDPGFKATGYGFIEYDKHKLRMIETGVVEPKQKEAVEDKLKKIHSILQNLIRQYKPQYLVLEKLYAHHKHPATASIMGHVRGVICLLCAQENVKLVEFSVKRIRKAITGNGNASKIQTRSLVAHTFHIDEKKLTLDASDALALALGFTYLNGRNL